jgi:hypothetical protein
MKRSDRIPETLNKQTVVQFFFSVILLKNTSRNGELSPEHRDRQGLHEAIVA